MSESEKLLSKKSSKKVPSTSKKESSKLFASKDDYGTLTKQYIVEDEYPRTHFSALHCVVVSFVFIFCLVFITTSLLLGLPRVRQRYQDFHGLNANDLLNTTQATTYTTTIENMI